MRNLTKYIVLANFWLVALAAEAQSDIIEHTFMDSVKEGKNLTSFRLRYETVGQDGLQPNNTIGTALNPTRFEM